jgi:hypothetical protein
MPTTMLPSLDQGASPATDPSARLNPYAPSPTPHLRNSGDLEDGETVAIEQDRPFHNRILGRLLTGGETVEADDVLDRA